MPRGRSALLAGVIAALCPQILPASGQADPDLRLLRFTADWCPTCRVLDPRVEAAVVEAGPGVILVSDFDLSDGLPRSTHQARAAAWGVEQVWQQYEGRTGFAVVVDTDTGMPLTCLGLPMSRADMVGKLRLASRLAAGRDLPESPFVDDCPEPGPGKSQPQP